MSDNDTARLVLSPEKQVTSLRGECDAHTALVRGLADYLATLRRAFGSTEYKFEAVWTDWPEAEDRAEYPAALVTADDGAGGGQYATTLPQTDPEELTETVGVRPVSELSLVLQVQVWATTPEERAQCVAMVEDGAFPDTETNALRLALPYYYGVHATYALASVQYQDTTEQAQRRYRVAVLRFNAACPVVRTVALPRPMQLRPRYSVG